MEYEIDYETSCPECGHDRIHQRYCNNFCDDGYFDEYEQDPINFTPGEEYTTCYECRGTGIERWCPNCGENLSGINLWDDDELTESDIADCLCGYG